MRKRIPPCPFFFNFQSLHGISQRKIKSWFSWADFTYLCTCNRQNKCHWGCVYCTGTGGRHLRHFLNIFLEHYLMLLGVVLHTKRKHRLQNHLSLVSPPVTPWIPNISKPRTNLKSIGFCLLSHKGNSVFEVARWQIFASSIVKLETQQIIRRVSCFF